MYTASKKFLIGESCLQKETEQMGALQAKIATDTSPIRENRFSTLVKKPPDQFAYWKNSLCSIFDVKAASAQKKGYRAIVRAHDLGPIQIASLRFDGMRYQRTPEHIRRSHLDHWQLVLRRSGYEYNRSAGKILRSRKGSLDLRSMSQPCLASSSSGEVISIWMKRDNFHTIAAHLDAACHNPIRGGVKSIFQEFIVSLNRYRSTIAAEDVPVVARSFSALLGAIVRPTLERLEEAATPIAASRLEIAKQFIDANLRSPDLSPEALCRKLNVSRRKLYYLFERSGGVAKFIRERRLMACHSALGSRSDLRLISTIAYDHGFSDPALFSRLFKSHYGYNPRDVRELGLSENVVDPRAPKNFVQWLLQVRDQ